MREIQASEAKAHLSQLLDAVERGEAVAITRHGRRVARIVPERDRGREESERAIETIREIRQRTKKVPIAEILSSRHEGHKV